jgi:hypothetical protein
MKFDQATGLCGGSDVPSGPKLPEAASRWKLGRRPASMSWRVSV